ncbi:MULTISPECIES: hypothetical protein [Streptomycetaceae]|uniref:hypothetical protein n=1 Tax=Streptomycetaceae TaxID=2062 RepID=UPI00332910BB
MTPAQRIPRLVIAEAIHHVLPRRLAEPVSRNPPFDIWDHNRFLDQPSDEVDQLLLKDDCGADRLCRIEIE